MDADVVIEGLRERKKRRTRERIAQVALELFARQGYHETTLAQVAAAAEVSPRTVSAYFPVKEELVFPRQDEWFGDLERRLAARAAGEPALEVVRQWIEARLSEWYERADEVATRRELVAREEALRAYSARVFDRAHDLLADAIARDLGRSPDDIEPRMAAAAAVAVLEVIDAHDSGPQGAVLEEWREQAQALLDKAVRFVTAGIESLERPVEGRQPAGRSPTQ